MLVFTAIGRHNGQKKKKETERNRKNVAQKRNVRGLGKTSRGIVGGESLRANVLYSLKVICNVAVLYGYTY